MDTKCSFSERRKFGWADGGWAIYFGLLLCAVAAFCKPIFSLSIYWLNRYFDGIFLLRLGAIIDWLSFQFEYLFGLLIQIFLVVLTFIWIRGLNSEPGRIFEFALKRAVFAAKWAGIVLLATFVLIHLPLLISYLWITQQTDFTKAVIQYIEQTARPLIAVALILFCSIQITLILHNETLRDAVHEHAQLARRHWFRIIWFLGVAGIHLFALSWLTDFIVGAFPKYSVPNLFFAVLFTLGRAFLVAWFLASLGLPLPGVAIGAQGDSILVSSRAAGALRNGAEYTDALGNNLQNCCLILHRELCNSCSVILKVVDLPFIILSPFLLLWRSTRSERGI